MNENLPSGLFRPEGGFSALRAAGTAQAPRAPRSLVTRLRLIVLSVSGVVLALAFSVFLACDAVTFRNSLEHRLSTVAAVLAERSAQALTSMNAEGADAALASLSSGATITSAALVAPDGRIVARYARPGLPKAAAPAPAAAGPDGIRVEGGELISVRPIYSNGLRRGTQVIASDLSEARDRFVFNSLLALTIVALSLTAAFLLSGRLAQLMTLPLDHLARIVHEVTARRDYSLRARKKGYHELGRLVDGINDMLSQIEVRDSALRTARTDLEHRVEERTAELSGEIAERKRIEKSLRENEQTMRILVDYAPDATMILDVESGRFIEVNRSAERLFGLTRGQLLQIGPRELSPAQQPDGRSSAEAAYEKIQEALAGRTPTFMWTYLNGKDQPIPCEVHLVRLPLAGRTCIRGSIVDITKRQEIVRMKDEFVSTVSHELRTPLTSIQGSLGLVAGGVLGEIPAAAKPLIDVAYKNCQRLVHLINDILDSEKIAAGKMKFTLQAQPLMPLVEQSIEGIRSYGGQFGVRFELAGSVPEARVEADADRIIQVLTNLLSNAAKFSPRNDVVTVAVRRLEGGRLRVSVSDRGPGIPEEFRSRIFQKFSQADSSDMRQKGGSGLGLNISREIIENHKGAMDFESVPGRGATFFVDLPELQSEADLRAEEAPPVGHFLLCSGDAETVRLVTGVLVRQNLRVDAAADAREAAALLERSTYDALALDLPVAESAAFLAVLKKAEKTRDLPVISLSGGSFPEGGVEVLDKPLYPAALGTAARQALLRSIATRARVLHVEPDADARRLAAFTLRTSARIVGAATLAMARTAIRQATFDLVILNVDLPDGSGMDLMPLLNRPGMPPIPTVLFTPRRSGEGVTQNLAGGLVRAMAAHEDLPESLRMIARRAAPGRLEGACP